MRLAGHPQRRIESGDARHPLPVSLLVGDLLVRNPANGLRELPAGEVPAPLDADLDLFRPPPRQRDALRDLARLPGGRVLVAEREGVTVGYLTFHPPYGKRSEDREDLGDDALGGGLIELGAVEVAPSQRGQRLGERLLEAGFEGGRYDDAVVFATLFRWHYDVERSGLGPLAYRRMLLRFYARVGLEPVSTCNPEVVTDPANALVARIGPNAPTRLVEAFDRLRCGPGA